ncbi:FtsX-like permease family protein, partial [bacterium]|nr:FtsX-like permease family protein [bacterium]
TGLIKTLPSNSHLQFSMLFSMATLKGEGFERYFKSWKSDNVITYAVVREGSDITTLQTSIRNLVADKTKDQPTERLLELQPLKDIHLYSTDIESDRNFQKSEPKYLYLFSIIALFVLAIASINYVNLATARSMNRAREVGVRKAVGARLQQLISQFVIESILMVFAALFLACGAVELFLPYFNTLASKQLQFSLLNNWMLAVVLLLFGLTVGLLSGAYPAFHLSRLKIVEIFKGRSRAAKGERLIRSGLVTGQFALSIVMIVITIAAYRQLQFIQQKRLGFKSDQLLVIDINTGNVRKNLATVKAAYAADPSVQAISVSSRVPGEWKEIEQIEAHVSDRATRSSFISCDEDFLKTFDMELIAGRNFSSAMGIDSLSVIINETAAIALGLSDPIGQRLRVPESNFEATIIGVVRDFHFRSLHEKVSPLVIGFLSPFGAHPIDGSDYFTIRFAPDRLTDMMEYLRKIGERFDPTHPFEYNFLDDKLSDFYKDDQRVSRLFLGGASLTIIIACMGLFSLAAFAAEQRRKEIGIRRVLGASSRRLIMLLSKDFLKLVLLANIIAWPVAYVLMIRWLEDFAYRITIGIEMFVIAGVLAFVIAWITVGWQAYRAASLNPVETLKYE